MLLIRSSGRQPANRFLVMERICSGSFHLSSYIILFISLLLFGISLRAQITITNSYFPVVGDTLRYSVDINPVGIVPTPPGGAQTWDLSGLQASASGTLIYKAASEGSVAAKVPQASTFTQLDINTEAYYSSNANAFNLEAKYGLVQPALGFTGLHGLMDYNPGLVERRAPLNFFDINQSSSGYMVYFLAQDFPDAFIQSLNLGSTDSLRIRFSISMIDVVNAYGTLIIPEGSYPVLRLKRTIYRETRLDAKIPPLGWLDVTDLALNFNLSRGVSSAAIDTSNEYRFYSNNVKEPIAIMYTQPSTPDQRPNDLLVVRVEFKNSPVEIPVPVQLISFSGISKEAENILQWKTATEINSDHFEIQRSTDGLHFKTVGTVQSANRPEGSSYQFVDNISSMPTSRFYYRLRMVDIDSRFAYSKVIAINSTDGTERIVLAGNPSSQSLQIVTPVSLLNKPLRAEVISFNGSMIKRTSITNRLSEIDISNLPAGKYLIRFTRKDGIVQTEQFIRQ